MVDILTMTTATRQALSQAELQTLFGSQVTVKSADGKGTEKKPFAEVFGGKYIGARWLLWHSQAGVQTVPRAQLLLFAWARWCASAHCALVHALHGMPAAAASLAAQAGRQTAAARAC